MSNNPKNSKTAVSAPWQIAYTNYLPRGGTIAQFVNLRDRFSEHPPYTRRDQSEFQTTKDSEVMTYSYDRTRLASQSGVIQDLESRSHKIRDTDSKALEAFQEELRSTPYDDDGPIYQGDGQTLQRFISIWRADGGRNIQTLYDTWKQQYTYTQKVKALEELKARTFIVRYWKGKSLGKPERIPREDIQTPWKPGFILLDETTRLQGRDFDSDLGPRLSIKSLPIGQELKMGTVKFKRLVETDRGPLTQYLVKPRSATGQKKFELTKKLQDLETDLRVDIDAPDAHREKLREEIAKLRKTLKL